jgi:tRNA U34 2-thiouridine synthase MnmA/TrmU
MKTKRVKTSALVLLSGGLDSILTVKLLQKQGIEITGLTFVSYFFDSTLAEKAAKQLKIKLKIIDFSDEHLTLIKNPRYGYGKAMNPCIDCHLLMLKKAKEIMKKEKFDFVATGEVLGERPMSQNKQALDLIEKESTLKGYLLRPLSAKLLEPTIPEKKGLVDRDKLLDIVGRSRKKQLALAKKWGIKEYPTPAGGCLLTDLQFGQRLRELFDRWPDCQGNDVKLLKLGRHFWVKDNKIVVGRNKEENEQIKKLARKGDILIEPKDFPGPTILIRSKKKILVESLTKAKELMIKYSPKLRNRKE